MSSLFLFMTVVQALVAAALVGVILMQKSEGGALGVGGSPGGLMSARGAADFLTRTTTFLAIMFVSLSIILAVLAAGTNSASTIDQSFERNTAPAAGAVAPAEAPPSDDPLAAIQAAPVEQAPAQEAPAEAAPVAPPAGE